MCVWTVFVYINVYEIRVGLMYELKTMVLMAGIFIVCKD